MKHRQAKRNLYKGLALLLVLWGLMALGQVWFLVFPWDIFIKICISFGIIAVIMVIFLLIWIEKVEEDRLKDENYLD